MAICTAPAMESHLKATYGFNAFREHQKEIIEDLLNGDNAFVILPTGGGKSLLYQFPATYTDKLTVVVSPLISLMNDQCIYLNSINIPCVCLNSESVVDISEYKNYKIIYTTPEFIERRIALFENVKSVIGLFAIDEAHCVSQWSHDFRESYLRLGIIKTKFPDIPILAVTATATPRVVDDIYDKLNIFEACEYKLGTRRTNLEINIHCKHEFESLQFAEPTIVYVQTRKMCESIHRKLLDKDVRCDLYHGGLAKTDKERSHARFISGDIMVIVATVSFGMGIDKSDIRHVVNYGVPNDIETYYQEIGRAGRDGLPCKASLYYNPQDFATASFLINQSNNPEQVALKMKAMNTFRRFLGEKNICRQQIIEYYFETGEYLTEESVADIPRCNMCDNCSVETKQVQSDISIEANTIYSIIDTQEKRGFTYGMEKTVTMIRDDPLFRSRSKTWIKELVEILITKDVLKRNTVGRWGTFVICVGKQIISTIIPVFACIDMTAITPSKYRKDPEEQIRNIRSVIAKRHNLLACNFMNDRVLMNVNRRKPTTVSQLWGVDGISDEFIGKYGVEFINEYNKKQSPGGENWSLSNDKWLWDNRNNPIDQLASHFQRTNGAIKARLKHLNNPVHKAYSRLNASFPECRSSLHITSNKSDRDVIYKYYTEGKTIGEISKLTERSPQTIEGHILHIFEHYDNVDIDPQYFGLTEELEKQINTAIKVIGSDYLKPIKDMVDNKVTYGQIKLVMIINGIDN